MNTSLIDTNWSTRLHTSRTDTMTGDAFSKVGDGRFCDTPSWNHLSSDMHQAVQESASGNDNSFGPDFSAPDSTYTYSLAILY